MAESGKADLMTQEEVVDFGERMKALSADKELSRINLKTKRESDVEIDEAIELYRLNGVGNASVKRTRVFRFRVKVEFPEKCVPWYPATDEIPGVKPNDDAARSDSTPWESDAAKKLQRTRKVSRVVEAGPTAEEVGGPREIGPVDEADESDENLDAAVRKIKKWMGNPMLASVGTSTSDRIIAVTRTTTSTGTTTSSAVYTAPSGSRLTVADNSGGRRPSDPGVLAMVEDMLREEGAKESLIAFMTYRRQMIARASNPTPVLATSIGTVLDNNTAEETEPMSISVPDRPIHRYENENNAPQARRVIQIDRTVEDGFRIDGSRNSRENVGTRQRDYMAALDLEEERMRTRDKREENLNALRGNRDRRLDVKLTREELEGRYASVGDKEGRFNRSGERDRFSDATRASARRLPNDCRTREYADSESEDEDRVDIRESAINTRIMKEMRAWGLKFSGDPSQDAEAFLVRLKACKKSLVASWAETYRALPGILTGDAATWYDAEKNNFESWSHFKREFRRNYVRSLTREELYDELRRRTQGEGESTAHYVGCCLKIIGRFKDPPCLREQVLMVFHRLRPAWRRYMVHKNIDSFDAIKEYGEMYENELAEERGFVEPPKKEQMRVKSAAPVIDLFLDKTNMENKPDETISDGGRRTSQKGKKLDSGEVAAIKNNDKKGESNGGDKGVREKTNPPPAQVKQAVEAVASANTPKSATVDYETLFKNLLANQTSPLLGSLGSGVTPNTTGGGGVRPHPFSGRGGEQNNFSSRGGRYQNFGNRRSEGPAYKQNTPQTSPFYGECFKCRAIGHRASECPTLICFSCNQPGHISTMCPAKASFARVSCQVCKTPGADFDKCPNCYEFRQAWGNGRAGAQARPLSPANRQ